MNRVFLSRAVVVGSAIVLVAGILGTTFPAATASGEVILAYEPISGIVSPPSIVGADVSGMPMMRGPGLTPVEIPGHGFMSSGFTPIRSPIASEAAEDYVSWGFESTVPWDLAAMDIAYFSASGPGAIHISLSVNGGPFEWVYMDHVVPQFPQRAEVTNIDLSTYTDVVYAEFRLYGWAAPDPNGLFSICPTTTFDGVNGLIVYGSYEPPVGPPESYWTNSAGGLFADAGPWSDGGPGPSTDAHCSLGGARSGVTLDADAYCQDLVVHGDAVSMALNGHLLHSTGVEDDRWSISVTGWPGQTSRLTVTAGNV
ncbi:MAG: hypothetical protein NTW96_08390, partial [Planctomycetia bacterium]|nr:hypothetical protein [Planctomycetia bacterium]